jgi:hypothetical protein
MILDQLKEKASAHGFSVYITGCEERKEKGDSRVYCLELGEWQRTAHLFCQSKNSIFNLLQKVAFYSFIAHNGKSFSIKLHNRIQGN